MDVLGWPGKYGQCSPTHATVKLIRTVFPVFLLSGRTTIELYLQCCVTSSM
jgi:hypothetical protein